MFDNLRDQPDAPIFHEDETPPPENFTPEPRSRKKKVKTPGVRKSFDQLTGTTAVQRFVLMVMLFLTICLLGLMLMVLTGKIVPTFLY